MLHFYQNNIYRVSFYSRFYFIFALLLISAIVFTFTFLGYQSPQIISFNILIEQENAGCQNLLNTKSFISTSSQEQIFQEKISSNLLCFFCLNTYSLNKPYGIHAIISGKKNETKYPPKFSNFIYSIGQVEKQLTNICWFNSQSGTTIDSFPEIVSTNNGRIQELLPLETKEIEWDCYETEYKWACKSKQVLYQSVQNYSQLFGFIQVLGTYLIDMQFAMIRLEENYFQFNEVMYIIWIGIELAFGCLLMVLEDEFIHQRKLVFIPTMGFRLWLFTIFIFNNHPLFFIQLFHDNIYVKMINIIFMCLAQSVMLFYCIHTTQRIYFQLEPKRWLQYLNLFICLCQGVLRGLLSLNQALNMLENLPSESLFISGTRITYFAVVSLIWLLYFYFCQILTFLKLKRQRRTEVIDSNTDKSLKLIFKFYKGLFLFLIYNTVFVSAYYARIIWQSLVYFDPNTLYYDHYTTTLWNSYIIVLFWFFDLQNPTSVQALLEEDNEEVSIAKLMDMNQRNHKNYEKGKSDDVAYISQLTQNAESGRQKIENHDDEQEEFNKDDDGHHIEQDEIKQITFQRDIGEIQQNEENENENHDESQFQTKETQFRAREYQDIAVPESNLR